jgi:hypothetical protein
VVWDHAALHKEKALGEVGLPYSSKSCGAGIWGGLAVGRKATGWGGKGQEGGSGGSAARVGSRGEGLIAGRVALYSSSFEYPALMTKKLGLYKWYLREPLLS